MSLQPNTEESTSKERNERARHWFLTWNNHTEESIRILRRIKGLQKYIIQEETGIEGTPHLQGVMSFKDAKKWTTLRKHAPIYWKPAKNLLACKLYCSKLETRTGHQWTKGYSIPNVVNDPLANKKPYKWQQSIIDKVHEAPDDRTIHWIWSVAGNKGKSTLCKHLVLKHDAIVIGGKWRDAYYAIAKRIENKQTVDLILFDLPKSQGNKISYTAIEGIKNGLFFSPKYESGMCSFNPPHIFIFANEAPEKAQLSNDRWVIKQIGTGSHQSGTHMASHEGEHRNTAKHSRSNKGNPT